MNKKKTINKLLLLTFSICVILSCFTALSCQRNERAIRVKKRTAMESNKTSIKSKELNLPEGKNRLIFEKSPYLLQHADNPVDWYPWGEEAFQKAKAEDKPLFVSIGYSTCHWCHVMEHESFEDPEIAALINKVFVSIKIDREERPDIDTIYMSAVQSMTGSGGWPLTVFLTHDEKPFYGGTYFPPYSKWGSPGFVDIINSIDRAWRDDREQLIASGESITKSLREHASQGNFRKALSDKTLTKSSQQLSRMYDSSFGGFGRAPKFPTTHNLSYLLRHWLRTQDANTLSMVEFSLKSMAEGGMYDHLGGGFHRYSTDQQWQIPHFEKMLYDQAIIARTYLEVYQITKNDFYARIAREIFDYVLRDMQFKEGGFYSAEDADSIDVYEFEGMSPHVDAVHEKKEGAFYLWKLSEIKEILTSDEAKVFNAYYGIKLNGNAKQDPHNEFTGKNVVFIEKTFEQLSQEFNLTHSQLNQLLEQAREKLLKVRDQRPRPHLDDKILTDWNGLMIGPLAFGAKVLNEEKYLDAAQKAADLIISKMGQNDRLLHRYRDQEASIDAMIEDYAFFTNALLDLYEATFESKYLHSADQYANQMVNLFWDIKGGGFFFTANDVKELIIRPKEAYDGAIPSGNSYAVLALLRLSKMDSEKNWSKLSEELFDSFSATLNQRPSAHSQMMIAFDFAIGPSQEIVLAGSKSDKTLMAMQKEIYSRFLPNKIILHHDANSNEGMYSLAPFIKNQKVINEQSTAYICENHHCKKPVNTLPEFNNALNALTFTSKN